jgi:hypothetical protein
MIVNSVLVEGRSINLADHTLWLGDPSRVASTLSRLTDIASRSGYRVSADCDRDWMAKVKKRRKKLATAGFRSWTETLETDDPMKPLIILADLDRLSRDQATWLGWVVHGARSAGVFVHGYKSSTEALPVNVTSGVWAEQMTQWVVLPSGGRCFTHDGVPQAARVLTDESDDCLALGTGLNGLLSVDFSRTPLVVISGRAGSGGTTACRALATSARSKRWNVTFTDRESSEGATRHLLRGAQERLTDVKALMTRFGVQRFSQIPEAHRPNRELIIVDDSRDAFLLQKICETAPRTYVGLAVAVRNVEKLALPRPEYTATVHLESRGCGVANLDGAEQPVRVMWTPQTASP